MHTLKYDVINCKLPLGYTSSIDSFLPKPVKLATIWIGAQIIGDSHISTNNAILGKEEKSKDFKHEFYDTL